MRVLVQRFARALPWLRAVLPTATAVGLLFAANVFLDSQTLTAEQVADAELGNASARFSYRENLPLGSDGVDRGTEALTGADGGPSLVLRVIDFPLYQLADDGVAYAETDWSGALRSNYRVEAGRLPVSPREIVVLNEASSRAGLGDRLDVLGAPEALVVVGVGTSRHHRQPEVLAAPGSWATFRANAEPQLGGTTGRVELRFPSAMPETDYRRVAERVAAAVYPRDQASREDLGTLTRRSEVMERAPELWTERSPILFWFPGLLLVPLSVVLTYLSMMRALAPAVGRLIRVGVSPWTAATAPWWVVLGRLIAGAAGAALVGTGFGWATVLLVADRWGNPAPTFHWPVAAALIGLVGVTVGAVVALEALVGRARAAADSAQRGRGRPRRAGAASPPASAAPPTTRFGPRAVAAVTCTGVVVYLFVSMRTTWHVLAFVCACVGLAASLAPALALGAVGTIPRAHLAGRLVHRLTGRYLYRTATYVAVIVVGVGLSTGIATSIASTVEAERLQQGSTVPPGVVLLDNDGDLASPVPPEVVALVERVPALQAQTPLQLWTLGRPGKSLGPTHGGGVRDLIVTGDPVTGALFAVESVADFERLIAGRISDTQRSTLLGGGVLLTNPTAQLETGTVAATNFDTGRRLGTFPAEHVAVGPAPYLTYAAGYMLVDTARRAGSPVFPGAILYTGVSTGDAEAVLQALTLAGINPENAKVHHELPPILPDAALVAACLAIFAMIVGIAAAVTRSQLQGMRPWVSQLRRIGVPTSWARKVLAGQYGVLTAVATVAGVVAGTGSLALAGQRLPDLVVVVPWRLVLAASIAMLLACLVSVVATLWRLDRGSPLEVVHSED